VIHITHISVPSHVTCYPMRISIPVAVTSRVLLSWIFFNVFSV